MNAIYMEVTPAQADAWLKMNYVKNRKFNLRHAQWLLRQILAGDWDPGHQGIALGVDGTMLDGQHRLWAIIHSDKACWIMVTFNVPMSAYPNFDVGKKRGIEVGLHSTIPEVATIRLALAVMSGVRSNPSDFAAGEVDRAIPLYRPFIEALKESCATVRKTRSSAPVQLAIIARMVQAQQSKLIDTKQQSVKAELLAQYRHFVLLNFGDMWPSLQALYRQLEAEKTSVSDVWALLTRTWTAFDPKARTVSRIIIKDAKNQFEEVQFALMALHEPDTTTEEAA